MIPKIIYEICIDWDADNWTAEPDFSEEYDQISGDVDTDSINFLGWVRGKQREEGNAPAATLPIRMKPGLCQKYSPFTTGILEGKVRPWLPVRVRITAIGNLELYEPLPVFAGFISRISINPHPDVQSVLFDCTDGTDLLARQLVTQDPADKELCSDGDAMDKILDAAGWSPTRRDIDKDGGDDLLGYPRTYDY